MSTARTSRTSATEAQCLSHPYQVTPEMCTENVLVAADEAFALAMSALSRLPYLVMTISLAVKINLRLEVH